MRLFSNSSVFLSLLLILGSAAASAYGQSTQAKKETYDSCMEQAEKFNSVNLVGEALEFLDKAKKKARTSNEIIRVSVVKGELLRSTQDYQHALETLWDVDKQSLKKCDPLWRLKLLGRLAAVHQEYGSFAKKSNADSVIIYIDSALAFAGSDSSPLHQSEIASLNNELGLYKYRKGFTDEAREHYLIACNIFEKLNEDKNLVTPLSNLLELESLSRNFQKASLLADQLEAIISDKDWYQMNIIAYTSLRIYASVREDKEAALRYELLVNQNAYANSVTANSNKMLALREIYEHDKLQRAVLSERNKRKLKAKELTASNENRKRLIAYLVLVIVIGFGSVLLFFRERRLKQRINSINSALEVANERNQLLVVESNHRIKNNLQMVTAMMQYTSKGLDPANMKVLDAFSGKINAISALHKHLYLDMHNEFIRVNTYFEEIIKQYRNISPAAFQIDLNVGTVEIRSERIVYFGLIFNEMISNTIEHSPETIGSIKMHITTTADGYQFMYSDNSSRNADFKEGMGTTLIRSLSVRVGGKNFHFNPSNGMYRFDFKVEREIRD